ncbi:MAG: hypothetical protein HYX27_14005 [Acidobacteria bacterium]|nr:hypothetical protein [Acidobacteriota bacterium]
MTKDIKLSEFRTCRLWRDELPDVSELGEKIWRSSLEPDTLSGETVSMGGIELFFVTGPKSLYALLGGQIEPGGLPSGQVVIRYGSTGTNLYTEALASDYEVVRSGLPEEYLESVVAGIRTGLDEMAGKLRGRLTIHVAAYSDIGSCRAIFEHAAAVLVRLLICPELFEKDDQLKSLIQLPT